MCKSASHAVLSRMQLTLHATRRTPHGASQGLVQTMPAWSVKTRRAPSRHRRDARVHGYTTTAMRDIEYTPPFLFKRYITDTVTTLALVLTRPPSAATNTAASPTVTSP